MKSLTPMERELLRAVERLEADGQERERRLVIVESPIDAMSHWELAPAEDRATTRYAAIRSGFREEDLDALIKAMPADAVIIGACDPDAAGDSYTARIQAVAMRAGRVCQIQQPDSGDWNDQLRRRPTQPPLSRRPLR